MGLILRTQNTDTNTSGISIKGSALSYAEGDSNFVYLLTNMSGSNINITGSTGIVGNVTVTGNLTVTSNLFATSSWATKALTSSFSTNITGSTNQIARYNGPNNLTSSLLSDNGNYIYVDKSYNGALLNVTNSNNNTDIYAVKGVVTAGGAGSAGIYGLGTGASTYGIYAEGETQGIALKVNGDGNDNIAEISVSNTNTITVSPSGILTLIPQHPLPTLQPTGSIAMSGSGANLKLYFYNGTSWAAV